MTASRRIWVPLVLAVLFPRTVPAQNIRDARSPVLVELFTSQGCSSCPPAEELLNDWGMGAFKRGEIIPLAFHVDYWDYLGWKDPYSSPLFTARQKDHARTLTSGSLYTPQMVVDGRVGFVGSDAHRAKKETEDALKRKIGLSISLQRLELKNGHSLKVTIHPAQSSSSGLRFFAVVFENGLSTQVKGGENSGRSLSENFVVREMRDITARIPMNGKAEVLLPQGPSWKAAHCGVVVFAQDERTLEIKGANCLYPLSSTRP